MGKKIKQMRWKKEKKRIISIVSKLMPLILKLRNIKREIRNKINSGLIVW
jgi:hypothetical protein